MNEESTPAAAQAMVEQASNLLAQRERLSSLIADIDLDHGFEDGYDDRDDARFGFKPMIRAFIYKHLRGLSQVELVEKLSNWPVYRQQFGFDRPPTQQAISYTWRTRFSDDLKRVIIATTTALRAEAHEQKEFTHLIEPPENKDDDEVGGPGGFTEDEISRTLDLVRDVVFSAFDSGRAENIKYDDECFVETQAYMSMIGNGTPQIDSRFRNFSDRDEAPHGDTHLRTVKKIGSSTDPQSTVGDYEARPDGGISEPLTDWRLARAELLSAFSDAIDAIVERLRPRLELNRPVTVAIDSTTIEYYGEKQGMPMVHGSKDSDPRYVFEMATLTVVGENIPIILAAEPWKRDSDWDDEDGQSNREIVERLLDQAEEHVDINLVMADREFDDAAALDLIDSRDTYYLVPKRKYTTEKAHIRRMHRIGREVDVTHGRGLHLGGGEYHRTNCLYVPKTRADENIFLSDDDPEGIDACGTVVFLTNKSTVTRDTAEQFVSRYRNRWQIENQYKTIKDEFLAPTSSKDYRVRLFYFLFGCLVYNVWHLTSFLLKDGSEVHQRDYKPFIPAGELVDRVARYLRSFG